VIDNFSILLSHALLAYALWHLMNRPDLDTEDPPAPDETPTGFAPIRRPSAGTRKGPTDA